MHWSDINFRPTTKTLRQFAALATLFLLAIGGWQHWAHGRQTTGIILAAAALVIGALGVARPAALGWLFVGLTMATFPIGWLLSWVLLGGLYYFVFTPLAVCFRIAGRDALDRTYNDENKRGTSEDAYATRSYWSEKPRASDVRRYFRQY
ncbi:MAG: hypothetical protein ACREHD_24525 [Pirellulales bacterium]